MTPTGRDIRAALGLPADADGPAVRAALLRRLPADGFVPPEDWAPAVNALAGAGLPVTPAAAASESLLAEVETFAADYWSRPSEERRGRWEDLSARCRGGPAAVFLEHLAGGLDVEATPHPDPAVEELAGIVREVFVLRPRPRAVRRAEWLAGRGSEAEKWTAAADRLRADAPATAALDPDLLDRLGEPAELPVAARWTDGSGWSTAEEAERRREAIEAFRRRMAETTSGTQEPEPAGWPVARVTVLIALCVLCAGIRGMVSNSSNPSPPRGAPTYQVPAERRGPSNLPIRQTFTREEIESFRRYQPRSGDPPPPGYDEWVRYTSEIIRDGSWRLPYTTIPTGRTTFPSSR